jgi:hypothetical protein
MSLTLAVNASTARVDRAAPARAKTTKTTSVAASSRSLVTFASKMRSRSASIVVSASSADRAAAAAAAAAASRASPMTRRDAMRASLASLATVVAANALGPVPAAVAGDPNKVVAVEYTPYVVDSASSAEAIEVAKSLKAAGARLYGAFWCENCNKQKEILGKEAMEYVNYVECFPDGVYQNTPGRADVTKPAAFCEGYTDAWPLWVIPKDGGDPGEEIGVAGKIAKPKELQRLIREAKGEKFDAVKYLTSGSDGYEKPADEKAE